MNIDEVQRRLWEQSQAHRQHRASGTPLFPTNPYGGRIRNLMDLMHNPMWIAAACDRMLKRSRGKASGVDGVTTREFARYRESRLEKLRLELKRSTYRPQPLRRVEIPKANGKMRQLGIPCLRDKIVQEAIRMALEPIFEVEFHEHSFGFRPNRSAHHAVSRCKLMALHGFTWIIEGDVNVIFICVDKIDVRRLIWEAVRDRTNCFCDGRMSAEVLRILTACDTQSREHYPTTLFSAEEAYAGACTAKTTIYCANIAAGIMAAQFAKYLRNLPVDPDIQFNLLSSEITVSL